jgi:hypothetical protein
MPTTVRVDPGPAGYWLITVPGQPRMIASETLSDAIRQARRIAETTGGCQLIVRNAYHRVIDREFVGDEPTVASPNAALHYDQRTRPRYADRSDRAAYIRNWRSNSGHQSSST